MNKEVKSGKKGENSCQNKKCYRAIWTCPIQSHMDEPANVALIQKIKHKLVRGVTMGIVTILGVFPTGLSSIFTTFFPNTHEEGQISQDGKISK